MYVGSWLDYTNAVVHGSLAKTLTKLQLFENCVARIVMRADHHVEAPPLLKKLHWLPTKYHIDIKTTVLTYTIWTTSELAYLSSLIMDCVPLRVVRSADTHLLQTLHVKTVIGSCSFRSADLAIWNGLPNKLRTAQSLLTF